MDADIITTWLPSFCIIQPVTPKGEDWLALYTPDLGPEGAVEHHYFADIVYAAVEDGLAVQDSATGRCYGDDLDFAPAVEDLRPLEHDRNAKR